VAWFRLPALQAGSWRGMGIGMRPPFGPVGQLRAAHRRRATMGEAAADTEQSSEACGQTGKGKAKWVMAPLDDVRSSAKEWPTHMGGDDRWPPAPRALHAVSTTTGNRSGTRDQVTVLGGQTEMGC
jgi:hypothetical protein